MLWATTCNQGIESEIRTPQIHQGKKIGKKSGQKQACFGRIPVEYILSQFSEIISCDRNSLPQQSLSFPMTPITLTYINMRVLQGKMTRLSMFIGDNDSEGVSVKLNFSL
jgi:hypothetical protein